MQHRLIEYKHNDTILEAYAAYNEAQSGRRPVVLIAHAWGGRDEFVLEQANRLAELGYVGFALDMYGKGVLGDGPETNSKLMQPLLEDRQLLQQRMQKGLDTARKLDIADRERVAVIGFCFGGLCALDLARSGADIRAAISFHGLFNQPENVD